MREPKIYIDEFCEVYDILHTIAHGSFTDFAAQPIRRGAVYVLGRLELRRCFDKVQEIIKDQSATVVFSNPAEGANTMIGQLENLNILAAAKAGQIIVLTGGNIDTTYRYFQFENFMHRMVGFDENLACMNQTDEIYEKISKPYKFLMLNGRMRPHRKWMLQRLRDLGLLEKGLYTNLHARNAPTRSLTYLKNGYDVMHDIEPIHYLPQEYELELYRDRVGVPCDNPDVKHHLFKNQWGEAYINSAAYIDTYFSIVTETVYEGRHSFRTEKIWKPIIMGQPWICLANAGFYRDLHNLGFKTFGNIIDESFDKIEDTQLRLEQISVIINELCNSDLVSFLTEARDICKYNQQRLLEYRSHVAEFPQQFVDFLRDQIQ